MKTSKRRNVKVGINPKALESEYKVIRRHKDLPEFLSELEQEAFWNSHRLSEGLIKRMSSQELTELGWRKYGKRVDGSSKPIKTPKNPIRTPEGRILITRASDIPDWHKLTYDEDADWYDEYELADKFRIELTPKECDELLQRWGIKTRAKRSSKK